ARPSQGSLRKLTRTSAGEAFGASSPALSARRECPYYVSIGHYEGYWLGGVESRKGAGPEPTGSRLFPFPAHQTGRVHFEHPAFRLVSPQHPRERSTPHGAGRRHRGFLASHCDTAGSKGHQDGAPEIVEGW